MGNRYVLPRKLTGRVPVRWTRRALEPLGNAVAVRFRSFTTYVTPRRILCRLNFGAMRTVYIGSRREGGISRERLGNVVVCSVHIVIFLRQHSQYEFPQSLGSCRDVYSRLSGRYRAS